MEETRNKTTLDADAYLASKYCSPGSPESDFHDFALQNLQEYFQTKAVEGTSSGELKVLDYGCGPVIANVISSATLASEIVLAEYTEKGREAIRRWLDRDPTSFNWGPYFEYVVQTLEGKSSPADVKEREERVRSVVKAVVSCDITQDPPIENGYEGPYDILISCLCLETACKTKQEYEEEVCRIWRLIKPGGVFLLYSTESETDCNQLRPYEVGGKTFYDLPLSKAFVLETLEKMGFGNITVTGRVQSAHVMPATLFFTAHKL